ncbi:MAG TPA: hypothetical protein VHB73_04660 [Alphaproteobacteria bacterium]|nr:hypothetical protein [Alphaproteobacteria bacterium]
MTTLLVGSVAVICLTVAGVAIMRSPHAKTEFCEFTHQQLASLDTVFHNDQNLIPAHIKAWLSKTTVQSQKLLLTHCGDVIKAAAKPKDQPMQMHELIGNLLQNMSD